MSGLLELSKRAGTPLVDGETITFVWEGRKPPALISDLNDWRPDRAPDWTEVERGVWTYATELPQDAYLAYAFILNDERFADPLNPHSYRNTWDEPTSYVYMPEAAPTPLVRRKKGVPAGRVERVEIDLRGIQLAVGKSRTTWFYQPPVDGPVPLLLVYDGGDYLRRGRLPVIVDNLIAAGRIRPLAMALVSHGGRARFIEYGCSEATLGFVMQRVLPLARQRLNLLDIDQHPGAYGVLGASLGGEMAMFTGLRLAQVFGNILSQSGVFYWNMPTGDFPTVVVDLVKYAPRLPVRIWMDVGKLERLLEGNRRMAALLRERGYDLAYREYAGGHDHIPWRDDVWRGLEQLFPPV